MAKGSRAGGRSGGKGRSASRGGGGGTSGGAPGGNLDLNDKTDAEVTEWQERNFDSLLDRLPGNESFAMSDYGGNVAENMNRYLRNGQENHPLVKEFVDQYKGPIDSAIARGRIPEALTVYRRVENLPTMPNVGDRLVDKGFMSTSLKGDWLRENSIGFARGRNPILMRISVAGGTPGISMHRHGIRKEHEILFGRNTGLRVTRVEQSRDSRGRPITIVHADME